MIDNKKRNNRNINLYFFIVLISAIVLITFIRVVLVDWINVSGDSMLPTLHTGEILLVNKTKHLGDSLEYGDIVVVRHPNLDTQLVKRVVGKAGDTIEIRNSILYINGKAQQESYIYPEPYNDMNVVLVDNNSIFVMGDNRNYSDDSRKVGSISDENIVGSVICVIVPFKRIK